MEYDMENQKKLVSNREFVGDLITKNPQAYSRKDILKKINWNLAALNTFLYKKKLAYLVKPSKRVRGKNKYPADNSLFYRAYDKKKLYEYYILYNQQ
jgi:hypothetical protein